MNFEVGTGRRWRMIRFIPIQIVLLITNPFETISQDLSSICISGGGRMAPEDFGVAHNYALEAAHDQILEDSPVDMESYIEIVKSQAKSICDGDGECLASIDNYTNHAINYAIQDQTQSQPDVDGDSRRLRDYFPENNFTEVGTQYFENILSLVSLESEEQIINALENLRAEVICIKDDEHLPHYEKKIVEGAISVAQASTAYWHQAYNDENNKFRHLAKSSSVFDCLLTGSKQVKNNNNDNHRRHLRKRGSNRKAIRENLNESPLAQPPLSLTLQNTEVRGERNLQSWRYHGYHGYHYKSKKKSKHQYPPKYQVEIYKHYEYRSPEYADDDDWYKHSSKDSHDNTDDWHNYYYYWYRHSYRSKSKSKSKSQSADYTLEIPSPPLRLGRFAANVAYVIRADIIGILVGAVLGRGCVIPTVAASFLFSATYAICYRRGL